MGRDYRGGNIGTSKSEACDSYAHANGQEPRGEVVDERGGKKQETSTEGCNKRDSIAHQELSIKMGV